MINPSEEDIGREVLYIPTAESGTITSFNKSYVFVRYVGDMHGKATMRCDLLWWEN